MVIRALLICRRSQSSSRASDCVKTCNAFLCVILASIPLRSMPARSRSTLGANDAARWVDASMRRWKQSSAPACRISRSKTGMRHTWSLLPWQHPSPGAQSPTSQVPSRRPATPQIVNEGLLSYRCHSIPNAAAKTPKAVTSDGCTHSCDSMLLGGQSARARAFGSVRPYNKQT